MKTFIIGPFNGMASQQCCTHGYLTYLNIIVNSQIIVRMFLPTVSLAKAVCFTNPI